jgi:hypothetical protein
MMGICGELTAWALVAVGLPWRNGDLRFAGTTFADDFVFKTEAKEVRAPEAYVRGLIDNRIPFASTPRLWGRVAPS